MAENTKIEWADHTFNPWIGCTKISTACDHCYAEKERASTVLGVKWGVNMPRHRTSDENWKKPLRWNAAAERHGVRESVFCASLGDWADNAVPGQWRLDLADLIRKTPWLNWLLLTKRIGNAAAMLAEMFPEGLPPNVRIGATIANQEEADRDIRKLLALNCPNFVSMEPLLGPVNLTNVPVGGGHGHHEFSPIITGNALHRAVSSDRVQWVIVGGESGPHARPMHPDWARSLRDQCQAAGVPFLFKQWGEWRPAETVQEATLNPVLATNRVPPNSAMSGCALLQHQVASMLDGKGEYASVDCAMFKAGKKAAGRLLDGRTWDGVPA